MFLADFLWKLGRYCGLDQSFLSAIKGIVTVVLVPLILLPAISSAQTQVPDTTNNATTEGQTQHLGSTGTSPSQPDDAAQLKPPETTGTQTSPKPDQQRDDSEGEQTKRILWIIPNYRAVSASTKLPPLSTKTKFWLATQDSFDYSSFILAGLLAGYSQAINSSPE